MKTKRKKKNKTKRKNKIIAVIFIVCVLVIAVIMVIQGRADKMNDEKIASRGYKITADGNIKLSGIKIDQQFISENPYSRPGTKLKVVNNIVVHYVGNPGASAQNNRNYFESLSETKDAYASSHYVVGIDGEIIQCIPLNEISYCSNNRNKDTISIEVCHPDSTGKFTDESYNTLIKLCAWLCEAYDLDAQDIIRHYDVTGKLCPLYYVNNQDKWDCFIDDVDSYLKEIYK